MRAEIDPQFEAQVARSLEVLHEDPRVGPWPSPLARVDRVVRHQNRVRASVGATGLAVAVAAAIVGVGMATGTSPQTVVPGASVSPPDVPTTAAALSFLPAQTAVPSTGAAVLRNRATHAVPPDTTVIPAASLVRMRAIAAQVETIWGDLAPTRIEVVYAKDGRALNGTSSDPHAPKTPAYALEMQGHFTCRSCLAARPVTAGVIFETYNAKFQQMSQSYGGNTWSDLNRFGKAVTLAPADPTATPRPLGPTLASSLQGKAPANLATAEQVALQEAVDPTTAKVAWAEEVTYAQLRMQSPRQFVKQSRKPGPGDKLTAEQFAAVVDNSQVIVVAVDGLILNEHENATRWAEAFWVTGPYAGGSQTCGRDLCGLKAPTR